MTKKISSPHTDAHYMTIAPLEGQKVTVRVDGTEICSTTNAQVVTEFARQPYDPVYYIPRSEVDMTHLKKNDKTSICPLKGEASFFDYGEMSSVAWSYEKPIDRSASLKDLIAFYPQNVKVSDL